MEAHFAQVNGITATVTLELNGQRNSHRRGNGRLDAVANAIHSATGMEFHLEIHRAQPGRGLHLPRCLCGPELATARHLGCRSDTDIIVAGVKALVSAINNK